ncbi:formate dehydrogenase subunit gamma [Hydrogenophaga sp. 2FB]|uniref:formate dehydrogenase subunit gamma n=1 Tax=Hydrogenophaga sp. 2FB TaxID=2502187 RepID=UPI0010F774B5|nr:formate dehydrogenase subunit gamma [Hydrogenophaga sp. 2FB]
MNKLLSRWLVTVLLSTAGVCAQAQTTAPAEATKGPPAGFVAPAEPQADENNAARARSQPGNNAPFWRGVRQSGETAGVTNLPGVEKGVLIQRFVTYPGSDHTNAGEAWRQVRNRVIIPYGGSLMLIVLVAIALFYVRRGAIGHKHPEGGRRIERFTPFERAAHWLNAIAFVLLALSGVVMAFGKFFLLPVLGGTIFGALTYGLKTLHNFVGPLFVVSLLVIIFTFIKDNLPRKEDWTWIKKGGGMLSGEEVPSHRFNAGEKAIFWGGVLVLGLTVIASGLVLDQLIPNIAYTRGTMQVAHMFHAIGAVLMVCAFFGHIYLGTIGMRGAYRAMRTGYVSEGWAREHHALWYEDIQAGKIPAQRSDASAPEKQMPPRPRGA